MFRRLKMKRGIVLRGEAGILAAAAVAALALVGCGAPGPFPADSLSIVVNSDIGTGTSRVQVAIVGPEGGRLGSNETPVSFEIQPADKTLDSETFAADWMWLVPDAVGLYRAEVDVPTAGVWQLTVVPESGPPLAPTGFEARDPTLAPAVGDHAPVAPIDTLATKSLEDLTTDWDPDADFYRMTLEDAFSSGRKTVVVFSTPAFCQTAICGPTLETVKTVKSEFPATNFVHVEVYTDINAPGFTPTPEFLHPALGPDYWNLPTEPWVFVVDEDGVISARFEGGLIGDDIRAVLG